MVSLAAMARKEASASLEHPVVMDLAVLMVVLEIKEIEVTRVSLARKVFEAAMDLAQLVHLVHVVTMVIKELAATGVLKVSQAVLVTRCLDHRVRKVTLDTTAVLVDLASLAHLATVVITATMAWLD